MRILIAAYACEPDKGSEPGVGWNLARELAREHEVWVITRANNREGIERRLREEHVHDLHFAYHDLAWALPWKKSLAGGLHLYHYLWHMTVLGLARRLHRQHRYHLVHHLTFGSFRFPSLLWKLGVPFVIGPVGGAEAMPLSFWPGLGVRGALFEVARAMSQRLVHLDPFVRRTYRQAAVAMAVTEETARRVRRLQAGHGDTAVLPQIGVVPGHDPSRCAPRPDAAASGLRVLVVARLVPWKGCHLALEAVARARQRRPDLQLTILGRGPARARLSRLIGRWGLAGAVTLIDRVETAREVQDLYSSHDVLLFPSLHEAGGMAVVEAMAAARPVVCLAIGGPAVSVRDGSGFAVPAETPGRAVQGLADALVELAEDRSLRESMGRAARDRALETFSWRRRAVEISAIYARAVKNAERNASAASTGPDVRALLEE